MIKILRKAVSVIVAAALSLSFASCIKNLNINNAQEVTDLLKQKYGIEFEVKSIGNRLANDKADRVAAYCYPKGNEKVIFEAVMNVNRELVKDDYPIRILEIEIKETIEKEFVEKGIRATVSPSLARLPAGKELLDLAFSEVVTKYPELSLGFTTVVCDEVDSKEIYDAVIGLLRKFYSGTPKMSLGTTIWKYPHDDYTKCSDELNSVPDISLTVLEQYGPISKVNVSIIKGEINIDYQDFKENF